MRRCSKCGQEKPISEFYRKRRSYYSHCKACHSKMAKAWLDKTENRIKVNALAQIRQQARKYGLSLAEYKALLLKMPDRCEVCGESPSFDNRGGGAKYVSPTSRRTIYIDHDHVTGAIRGFLCHGCNFAIGMVYEDPEVLRKLADYLERHRMKAVK